MAQVKLRVAIFLISVILLQHFNVIEARKLSKPGLDASSSSRTRKSEAMKGKLSEDEEILRQLLNKEDPSQSPTATVLQILSFLRSRVLPASKQNDPNYWQGSYEDPEPIVLMASARGMRREEERRRKLMNSVAAY